MKPIKRSGRALPTGGQLNSVGEEVTQLQGTVSGAGVQMHQTGGRRVFFGRGQGGASGGIWVKITNHSLIGGGDNRRFTYSWAEVLWDGAGYTGWILKAGGRTGTNTGYNLAEVPALAMRYRPVPNDTIALLFRIVEDVYWFNGDENADTNTTVAGATLKTLAQTQGAQDVDEWDITVDTPGNADGDGVSLQVITDIRYDMTNHKLQYRTRLLTFDDGGRLIKAGAESALIDIIDFVSCVRV